jgi:hypothetical protein
MYTTTSIGFSGTAVHPIIQILILLACFLIIIINIRYSIFLMIFLSVIIPLGGKFDVFTLNITPFRLFIIAGWIKVCFSQNLRLGKIQRTDKAIIYWVLLSFIFYLVQHDDINALKNQLGFAYNCIGIYFLYRILIKRKEDIYNIINSLAIVSLFIAVFMLIEQMTGENMFYVFGGVKKLTSIRMGRIRSQGPFVHPIPAGVFGATMIPLFFSMWRYRWGSAFWGIIGFLSAWVIVVTSSSSTSLIAGALGFSAILFWPFRIHIRKIAYVSILSVIVTQIIISSPIWAFIKHMDFIKGSAALHRFELVDNLINRFTEWFLIGSTTIRTWGPEMTDQANQYYHEAVTGGLFRLILFITIIAFSFKMISNKINIVNDTSSKKKFWAFGACLFTNVVAFIGISYWDQMVFVWYLTLALVTSACLINDETNLIIDEVVNK